MFSSADSSNSGELTWRYHSSATTWSNQLDRGGEQVKKQVEDFFHAYRG
jgi:hypothetical protein